MRIGELLLESALITAKELDDALYYGRAKALPLGRCLKILRSITDENLTRALEAQKLIRGGLDSAIAVDVLKTACTKDTTFHEALQKRAKAGEDNPSGRMDRSQVEGSSTFSRAITFPHVPALVLVEKNQREPVYTLPAVKTRTFEEQILEGDQLLADDRCADAEESYLTARQQAIANHGEIHEQTAVCCVKLANLYLSLDRFREAEPLYQRSFEIYTRLKGAEHPLVAKALEDLGDLFMAQGDFAGAEGFFNSSFAIAEKFGELDIATVGRLLNKFTGAQRSLEKSGVRQSQTGKKIGEFCTDAGLLTTEKLQQALQRSKQTGKPLGSVLRTEDFLTAQQLDGTLFAQMLTKQEMVPYTVAVRALGIASKANVPLRQIAESGRLISESQAKQEEYKQMVVEHERLMVAENTLGADHAEIAPIAARLADLVAARDDRQTAIVLLKRAFAILQKTPDSDKLFLAGIAEKLATLFVADAKPMEAQPLLLKALELRQLSGTSESPAAVSCLMLLGEVEAAQENYGPAVSFYRAALALQDKLQPGACPHELLQKMANCFERAGLFAEAEAMHKRLITWAQISFGPFEPETATYMEELGDMYNTAGERQQAEAQYFFALQIFERTLANATRIETVRAKLTTP